MGGIGKTAKSIPPCMGVYWGCEPRRGWDRAMALTDVSIRNAKPGPKAIKLADGGGMFLLVTPAGGKLWRLKYRIGGKEKKLSLGSYPDVGLKNARAKRDDARRTAQAGADPAVAKREARVAKRIAGANTFTVVAEEYIDKLEAEGKAAVTVAKTRWLLSKLTPALGTRRSRKSRRTNYWRS